MSYKSMWISVVILVIVAIIAAWLLTYVQSAPALAPATDTSSQSSSGNTIKGTFMGSASYACDSNRTIQAAFYDASSTPPTPGGTAIVALSDGRTFKLGQTVSADGARYANPDESFVFWNKGQTALVLEDGVIKDYTNCKMVTE